VAGAQRCANDRSASFSQRVGTVRVYSILDERGNVLCSETVSVRSPYETIKVVCDPDKKGAGP
jgi:hypothetical protein